jgi:hypothetical protein
LRSPLNNRAMLHTSCCCLRSRSTRTVPGQGRGAGRYGHCVIAVSESQATRWRVPFGIGLRRTFSAIHSSEGRAPYEPDNREAWLQGHWAVPDYLQRSAAFAPRPMSNRPTQLVARWNSRSPEGTR